MLPISFKAKSCNILSEHGDILQKWRQYYCDLQTIGSETKKLICENLILSNFEEVPPPTFVK